MGLWNRLTFSRRLFLWLVAYSMLMVVCFVVFQYHREKEFKISEINTRLQSVDAAILSELEGGMAADSIPSVTLEPFGSLRVSVIRADGEVIYDNTLDSVSRTNHLDREEIRQALAEGSGFAVHRHSSSTGTYYFYSALKGKDGYIVRTGVPYTLTLRTLLAADYGFIWAMLLITVIMCMVGYFATRRLAHNIGRLKEFAYKVESGGDISDIAPFHHDELGDISNNIVNLYSRLQQAISDRDREHHIAMYEQEEKERIKKQLTNNINHELKTPVASIRLCVETMLAHKSMDTSRREKFLNQCLVNVDRLSRLLADVALITRMGEGGDSITKEAVDLTQVISAVVTEWQPMAETRGMSIVNEVHQPLIINGNTALLESVFNNLLSNAISYSGGTKVDIRIKNICSGEVVLQISDNGTGVGEKHLPRLFERFYRVDKGRSREAGGTGLGLAIVKNAILLHGGSIKVENLKTGGLCFTMTLPLNE